MQYSKRIEINNLREIQQELINYNFFEAAPDIENADAPLIKDLRSGISFSTVPNLPKLKEFLESTVNTNLITHFHIINIGPMEYTGIHHDVDDETWALNIPILNCEYSSTVWYDDNDNELERICLDTVHFLNVVSRHQVINHCDENRLVITIRFTGTHDLDKIRKSIERKN